MQFAGMDRNTGKKIDGLKHLRQSVQDIFTTKIGWRVMRRPYGSAVPGLVDAPMGPWLVTRYYSAIAEALVKWEPRLRLRRMQVDFSNYANGQMSVSLVGLYVPENKVIRFDDLVLEVRELAPYGSNNNIGGNFQR